MRIWKRLEQCRVDHAENGAVGPDTKCEGEHGNGGKARRLGELATGKSDVAQGVLQLCPSALITGGFLDEAEVAESPLRDIARLVGRKTVSEIVCSPLVEMKAHLLGHVALQFLFAYEHAQSAGESGEQVHGWRVAAS